MKPTIFTYLRFGLALATVALLVSHPYIPGRKLLLYPIENANVAIDGHFDPERGNSNVWLNKEKTEWLCHYRPEYGHNLTCGFSLSWGTTFARPKKVERPAPPECADGSTDEDGDGWGWENEQSCIVKAPPEPDTSESVSKKPAECRFVASDEDGDGWGWENEQSCIVTANSLEGTPVPLSEVTAQQSMTEQAPTCESSDSDEDGDGWGWENNQSCLVAEGAAESFSVRRFDMSSYDYLLARIHYEGRARSMRFNLRSFNPEYATPGDLESTKFMSVPVRTEDLKTGPVKIYLNEFRVDEWWINQRNAPRHWMNPELDAVVVFGMDLAEFGVHKVRVERLELYGEWISRDELLMVLSVFWGLYVVGETIARFFFLHRESVQREKRIRQLTNKNTELEEQRGTLDNLSRLDGLTGALNRYGLALEEKALFEKSDKHNVGVLMLDIDHFKRINDIHGHDVGDKILVELIQVVQGQVQDKDIVARWGGEEFIVVSPGAMTYKLLNLAEKLREAVEHHAFNINDEIKVTLSIGATMLRKQESMEAAYTRADTALYKAKNGRNRVEFEV